MSEFPERANWTFGAAIVHSEYYSILSYLGCRPGYIYVLQTLISDKGFSVTVRVSTSLEKIEGNDGFFIYAL